MKIGVYGGSFDPIHVGHMNVATQAIDQLGLDLLVMVPTGASVSNHDKTTQATPIQRYQMCRLAAMGFSPKSYVHVSDVETYTEEPVQTVQTLRKLIDRNYLDFVDTVTESHEWWFIHGAVS